MSRQIWQVVGGADKGGIVVRLGQELSSAQDAKRLSTGAKVKELSLIGERLRYELVSGTGPPTGWVSVKLKDKELIMRLDVPEKAAMELYCKACTVGGGAKGWSTECESLYTQALEALGQNCDVISPTRVMLELMSASAANLPHTRTLISNAPRDSLALNGFFAFTQRALGALPLELEALQKMTCTAKLAPKTSRLQVICSAGDQGFACCVVCWLKQGRPRSTGTDFRTGAVAPFLCRASEFPINEDGIFGPPELETKLQEVANGGAGIAPAGFPWEWRKLLNHVASLHAFYTALGPTLQQLGAAECVALRELDVPAPPIKLHVYKKADSPGLSRLVVLFHGGMQKKNHLDYMHAGIFGPDELGDDVEIVGVEADFAYEQLGAGLTKPAKGFNYLRFESFIVRLGEIVLSAARVYRQCIEPRMASSPKSRALDLIGFSAGGLLSWILLWMMPVKADPWRLQNLVMMSPRLEGMMIADPAYVKDLLKAHGTNVYLGWGSLEDDPANGAPFTAMREVLEEYLPSEKLCPSVHANIGHVLPVDPVLQDSAAFIRDSWAGIKR